MRDYGLRIFCLLLGCGLAADALGQAIPASAEISLLRPPGLEPEVAGAEIYQDRPAVAAVPGGFLAGWSYLYQRFTDEGPLFANRILTRRIGLEGQPGPALELAFHADDNGDQGFFGLRLAPSAGGFFAGWSRLLQAGSAFHGQAFEIDGRPRGPLVEAGLASDATFANACGALAGAGRGPVVAAWGSSPDTVLAPEATPQVWFQSFRRSGAPASPLAERIADQGLGDPSPDTTPCPAVGSAANGDFVVAWVAPGPAPNVWFQRFRFNGEPKEEATAVLGMAGPLSLAMEPDGDFVLLGNEPGPFVPQLGPVLVLQRFDRHGREVGPLVSSGAPVGGVIALDGYGRVLVGKGDGQRLALSWLDRRLLPQGPSFTLDRAWDTAGAFDRAGRAFVAWNTESLVPLPSGARANLVRGRLFRLVHDVTSCQPDGTSILCTELDGEGEPERFPVAAESSADLVTGDADGDGLADLCLVGADTLVCDTDHDGFFVRGLPEEELELALPPLAGAPGAGVFALLGDVDGDGRTDACRAEMAQGLFRCDTQRDGSAFLAIRFGRERALLGDADGDGRDDACYYNRRTARFVCDTAHDGGSGEHILSLRGHVPTNSEVVPLFADLDGDGRDEACAYLAGRLVCGLFGPRGGLPTAVLTRNLAGSGVPVLADLDGI